MKFVFIKPYELDGHKISFEYIVQKKELQKLINNFTLVKLNSLTKSITSGVRIERKYYCDKKGYKVIAPGDIKSEAINFGDLKSIRTEFVKDKDLIMTGDVLIAAAGRSGRVLWASDELEGCAITSDVIKIRLIDNELGLMVYRFLKSNLGQKILDTIKTGLLNKISVVDIENLLIPKDYTEKDASRDITFTTQIDTQNLYNEANNIFSKYMDYQSEKLKHKFFFIYKHLSSNRLHPEYYLNINSGLYGLINTNTKNVKWQILGELIEIKVAVKPEINSEDKVKYFTISDVDGKSSAIKDYHEDAFGNLSNRMRNVVRQDEIVTAKAGSATGTLAHASALITDKYDGMITTDAFFNIRTTNIDKYYLLFLLKQPVILDQINIVTKGTIYKLVNKVDFCNIKIPRLNRDVENLISNKVKDYIVNQNNN